MSLGSYLNTGVLKAGALTRSSEEIGEKNMAKTFIQLNNGRTKVLKGRRGGNDVRNRADVDNKDSSDYPFKDDRPRSNQNKRRNSRRRNHSGSHQDQGHAQHFAAPITLITTVVVKPKRAPFKVIIDEGGTMRAIPLV